MNETYGIVYVLINPAMPNIVKIGITKRDDLDKRLNELYNTSVPVPFECVYACRVANYQQVEKSLHLAFHPDRVNPRREFFQIEPEQVIVILKLLALEEITGAFQTDLDRKGNVDEMDKQAGEQLTKQRRPNLDLLAMGCQVGDVLHFTENEQLTVTIVGNKTVALNGEEMSLSKATKQLLNLDYNVRPTAYWTYQGRNLSDIYADYVAD